MLPARKIHFEAKKKEKEKKKVVDKQRAGEI